jgi:ABC-type dipeptide/oligopeptide/nickel transport system permease subunit
MVTEAVGEAVEARPASRLAILGPLRDLRHHPLGMFGLVVIVLLVVVALLAPLIAPYSPIEQNFAVLDSPSASNLFGTDRLGRDVLSRVIYGARLSLGIGLTSVFFGVMGGTVVGTVSGFLGGRIDTVIQRLVDMMLAFPPLILLMAITAALGASVQNVVIAISIGLIPGTSRIIRGAVLSEKNNQYVEAARVMGASDLRLIIRHVLPNVTAPIIVIVSILIPAATLLEAALSFLGLGVPPPTPSWGADLGGQAREYFRVAPWMAIFPGAALSLTVLAFNMLGDALRDILDPRLRQGRR